MAKFWNFIAKNENTAELQLYGTIAESSWWDDIITPKQFAADLKALGNVSNINVRINSGGGDVFAGQTIYALLKSHKAFITVFVDGLAASIASIIAMAADKLVMYPGSMLMIHNPWSSVWGGEASDFRQMADVLDKIRDGLVATYADKCGKSVEEIKQLMDAETWMTAQEAVEMGFADEIVQTAKMAASINKNVQNSMILNGLSFDMNKYLKGAAILEKIKETQEGDEPMEFEEIVASLPQEHQTAIRGAVAAALEQGRLTAEASFATDKTALENTILDLKGKIPTTAPTEDEILASVSPEVRAMLDTARQAAAMANAELLKARDEKELGEFKASVAKFDKLPVNAEELAPVFRNFAKADAEGYKKLEALLTAANNCVEKGELFSTNGSRQTTGVSAWAQIQALIKDKMTADNKLSYADALSQVCKSNADLYNAYVSEMRNDEQEEEVSEE